MNKRFLAFVSSIIVVFTLVSCQPKGPVTLDASDYQARIVDVSVQELDAKIAAKDSFILYLSSPSCLFCQSFSPNLEESVEEYQYTVYRILFPTLSSNHVVYKRVQFTPGMIVFAKGKIVASLDPTKSQDATYYESYANFITWLTRHITFPTT